MRDERIYGQLSYYLDDYELIHLSEDFEEIVDILNNNIKS